MVGGLIFSLPLLYTMEMWWAGFQLGSVRLLWMLAFTCLLLLAYNTYAGVHPDETWLGVVIDSVEELGLALVVSASFLYLLGRIHSGDSVREVMGKIVVEALLIAIGISIGTSQLVREDDDEASAPGRKPKDILGVVSLSTCGAVVLATNIAPTDEIVVLALQSSSWQLLAMVFLSWALCGLIMVFSDLMENRKTSKAPRWERYGMGICLTYAVALSCSATLLFLFGRFDGLAMSTAMALTVVLAVPSSMGAAAGKLLIR